MTPALQRAYADAIEVQNACNGVAVINTLARHLPAILDEARARGEGTAAINTHPIIRCFLSKLASLAGGDFDPGSDAWVICESMSKEPTHV